MSKKPNQQVADILRMMLKYLTRCQIFYEKLRNKMKVILKAQLFIINGLFHGCVFENYKRFFTFSITLPQRLLPPPQLQLKSWSHVPSAYPWATQL